MRVNGPLQKATFERLASDPTGVGLFPGRFWLNTTDSRFKFYTGTFTRTLAHYDELGSGGGGGSSGGGLSDFSKKTPYTFSLDTSQYLVHQNYIVKLTADHPAGEFDWAHFSVINEGSLYSSTLRSTVTVSERRSLTDFVISTRSYAVFRNTSGSLSRILLSTGEIVELPDTDNVEHFAVYDSKLLCLNTDGSLVTYSISSAAPTGRTQAFSLPQDVSTVSSIGVGSSVWVLVHYTDGNLRRYQYNINGSDEELLSDSIVEFSGVAQGDYYTCRTATQCYTATLSSDSLGAARLDITGLSVRKLGYSRNYGSFCVFVLTEDGDMVSNNSTLNFSDGDILDIATPVNYRPYIIKADGIYDIVEGTQSLILSKTNLTGIATSRDSNLVGTFAFTTDADGLEYIGDFGQGVKTVPTAIVETSAVAISKKTTVGTSSVGAVSTDLTAKVTQNSSDILDLQAVETFPKLLSFSRVTLGTLSNGAYETLNMESPLIDVESAYSGAGSAAFIPKSPGLFELEIVLFIPISSSINFSLGYIDIWDGKAWPGGTISTTILNKIPPETGTGRFTDRVCHVSKRVFTITQGQVDDNIRLILTIEGSAVGVLASNMSYLKVTKLN